MGLLMKKHTSTCSLGKGIKPDSDPVFNLAGIFRNSEEHVELSMRQQNRPDGLQGNGSESSAEKLWGKKGSEEESIN